MTAKQKSKYVPLLAILLFALMILCIPVGAVYAASDATVIDMGKIGESEKTIKVSSSILVSSPYIKVKPNNTGSLYLSIASSSEDYANVAYSYQLFVKKDGEYQSISKISSSSTHKYKTISVKKGKTYFIKICECDWRKPKYLWYNDELFVTAENEPILDTGGEKKSDAKKIKHMDDLSWEEGAMHYHHALNYWYKFKVTKKGNYWINLCLDSDDLMKKGVTLSLYQGSSSEPVFKKTIGAVSDLCIKRYKCKLPKGTYYIKIHSNSKYNNAFMGLWLDSHE